MSSVEFDRDLIRRYDRNGPRYTSYPTAASFHNGVGEAAFIRHADLSNECPVPRPLSLYVHIPFCDTLCFYCGCNKITTKNRYLADGYLEYIDKEASLMANHFDADRVVEQLHWGGGTPTFMTMTQIRRLMEILSNHWNLSASDDRDFSIEIDPRSIDAMGMHQLAKLGFNRFSLGVQDLDEKVQKAINRIQPLEVTRNVIDACRHMNAKSVNIDLIYGLPFQTMESFSQTLDTMIELSPDRLSVFNYAHMPDIFPAQKRIHESELPSAEEKLAMLGMIVEKLTDAGYIYIGMDHFAKPDDELVKALDNGSLHRNFQGYTTHAECDLVSLGVSAISSFDRLFSQNEKTLEAYYEKLDAGYLPTARGVELDDDDVVRREAIQQLMCTNELDCGRMDKFYGCHSREYFNSEFKKLTGMQDDGLLEMDESHIHITPKGRFLARNIAMVFDVATAKLRKGQRFSKVI